MDNMEKSIRQKTNELKRMMQEALQGGGMRAVKKQKIYGKLTARERILRIVDQNSFYEYDLFVQPFGKDFGLEKKHLPGDGVITGTGTIDGRSVCIYSQDFTIAGGSLGYMQAQKICKMIDLAIKMKIPLVGINDSEGIRLQEGIKALAGLGDILYKHMKASGIIPQISVILGPCEGLSSYLPTFSDFIFTVDKLVYQTNNHIGEKNKNKENYENEIDNNSNNILLDNNKFDFVADTEDLCFDQLKKLFTYIPDCRENKVKIYSPKQPKINDYKITSIFPKNANTPYDVRSVLKSISDSSDFFEVQGSHTKEIVIGYMRINGETVGIVANQPSVNSTIQDAGISEKAVHFIQFCDAFNIPIITWVDSQGNDYFNNHSARNESRLMSAYIKASIPKITIILRKAYGDAYLTMGSRHAGADFVFAWSTAEISVMESEKAISILFKEEQIIDKDMEIVQKAKIEDYKKKAASPYAAAAYGYIDAVIEPSETRNYLIHALKLTSTKVRDKDSYFAKK